MGIEMQRVSLPALALLLVASHAAASAQERANDFVIEEILVTAEKRDERSIMDTSFSVGALTGDQLESRGVTSVMDALTINPGVSVYKFSGTGNFIQIRGISGVTGDATVGYYLDDLPYAMLGLNLLPDVNPYDLERLEVLRGPQGTLYGASSLGGTIRVLTNSPEHNEFYGKIAGGYSVTDGADSGWQTKGAVNIPLIDDTLSARIVASRVEDAGFIDIPGKDDHNDSVDESYRAKLRWTPNEDADIVLSAWYFEKDAGLGFANDDYSWAPVYGILNALTSMPVGAIPIPADELRNEFEGDLYNLRVSYDFGDYTFFSGTSYIDAEELQDINYFGTPFAVRFAAESLSHEMRLSFSGASMSWTAGVFYSDTENTQRNTVSVLFDQTSLDTLNAILGGLGQPPLSNPFPNPITDQFQSSEQFAFFGEVQFDLSEEVQLTAGLRYFDDDREDVENLAASITARQAVGLNNKSTDNFKKTTGRLNLSWKPDVHSLYYINIAQGFRSGRSNGTSALVASITDPLLSFPPFTDAEDIISYDLGAKLTRMDGRLAIEAALYYIDWSDVIASVTVLNSVGLPASASINANDVKGLGLDVGVTYRATEQLQLSLSGNINETEYQEDVSGAGVFDGDQVALAPETTLLATALYTWNISNDLNGSVRASYQYTDERSDYGPGLAPYTSDAISTLDVRVGVESDRWSIYLTGQNLTDEDGEVSQITALSAAGVPANRLRPLTIGLEATLNF